MAREKTIELTMMSGAKYFVSSADMGTLGISDNPESYVNGYIRGTRGGMMRVNTLADGSGVEHFINAALIESMTITYL
ncbi:hypothetical protein P59_062 [Bacillus phage P59]|nr:hypothetical protein P59_062 [Bacillus phage P59]